MEVPVFGDDTDTNQDMYVQLSDDNDFGAPRTAVKWVLLYVAQSWRFMKDLMSRATQRIFAPKMWCVN